MLLAYIPTRQGDQYILAGPDQLGVEIICYRPKYQPNLRNSSVDGTEQLGVEIICYCPSCQPDLGNSSEDGPDQTDRSGYHLLLPYIPTRLGKQFSRWHRTDRSRDNLLRPYISITLRDQFRQE